MILSDRAKGNADQKVRGMGYTKLSGYGVWENLKFVVNVAVENISRLDVKSARSREHSQFSIHNNGESSVVETGICSIHQINDVSQKEIFCDCFNRMLDVTWQ